MNTTGLPPSPRPITPTNQQNPFDVIQKAPSITMEKIKTQTSATLDRMSILQQRYRQHQEIMKADGDQNRRASTVSQADDNSVSNSYNQFYFHLFLFCQNPLMFNVVVGFSQRVEIVTQTIPIGQILLCHVYVRVVCRPA